MKWCVDRVPAQEREHAVKRAADGAGAAGNVAAVWILVKCGSPAHSVEERFMTHAHLNLRLHAMKELCRLGESASYSLQGAINSANEPFIRFVERRVGRTVKEEAESRGQVPRRFYRPLRYQFEAARSVVPVTLEFVQWARGEGVDINGFLPAAIFAEDEALVRAVLPGLSVDPFVHFSFPTPTTGKMVPVLDVLMSAGSYLPLAAQHMQPIIASAVTSSVPHIAAKACDAEVFDWIYAQTGQDWSPDSAVALPATQPHEMSGDCRGYAVWAASNVSKLKEVGLLLDLALFTGDGRCIDAYPDQVNVQSLLMARLETAADKLTLRGYRLLRQLRLLPSRRVVNYLFTANPDFSDHRALCRRFLYDGIMPEPTVLDGATPLRGNVHTVDAIRLILAFADRCGIDKKRFSVSAFIEKQFTSDPRARKKMLEAFAEFGFN